MVIQFIFVGINISKVKVFFRQELTSVSMERQTKIGGLVDGMFFFHVFNYLRDKLFHFKIRKIFLYHIKYKKLEQFPLHGLSHKAEKLR